LLIEDGTKVMEQIERLHRAIGGLVARVRHLVREAKGLEAGKVETRKKFDQDNTYTGREEVLKFQPGAAVAYWKEVRETEKRLDEKRAALRALEASGEGEPVRVEVSFDGPEE